MNSTYHDASPCVKPYTGLSYEWECSGTARTVVDGSNDISAPSLRGGTGTGEIGIVLKPMGKVFWVDISMLGYLGDRQGISGAVRLRLEFEEYFCASLIMLSATQEIRMTSSIIF